MPEMSIRKYSVQFLHPEFFSSSKKFSFTNLQRFDNHVDYIRNFSEMLKYDNTFGTIDNIIPVTRQSFVSWCSSKTNVFHLASFMSA